ncbi:MAG: FAD-dependent oxidoreductase, partial [Bacteroidales bacterium]|nr:FAD-dependent oxidoreductase [Bacteroidales bacterium]
MDKKIIIIGAGLGALASGLLLSRKGYKVEFVEKNNQAGGRLNQIKKDGFTFDTGPSFFSMSFVFKDFIEKCGLDIPFKFVELDPLYSVNFRDSNHTYHLNKDIKKLAKQFEDIEPDFEKNMEKYLKKSKQLFEDTFDIVIKNNFNSIFDYVFQLMHVNPVHIPQLFNNFYSHVQKHFSSKEAQQVISLVAFFLGRTPFDTMAIYSLLSHTEFRHDGYYNVEGGMYNIVNGLVGELEKSGAVFNYNSEIVKVEEERGKVKKVIDKEGKEYLGDVFLINADAALFRGRVLNREKYSEKKLSKMEWTMGYLTFYVGIKGKLPQLDLHNYFIGNNFEEYAKDVMHKPDTLQKPYFYVNNVS